MGFRNELTALSQLIADIVTGAILQTSDTGNRVKIWSDPGLLGVDPGGRVDFETDAADVDDPATLWLDSGPPSDDRLTMFGSNLVGMLARPFVRLQSHRGTLLSTITLRADSIVASGLLAPTQLQLGTNGPPITALDFGYFSGNTDGSSQVTVPHDLGAVPTAVIPGQINAGSPYTPWNAKASNDAVDLVFTMRHAATNGLPGGGVAVEFFWLALR